MLIETVRKCCTDLARSKVTYLAVSVANERACDASAERPRVVRRETKFDC